MDPIAHLASPLKGEEKYFLMHSLRAFVRSKFCVRALDNSSLFTLHS
jgi:hypothetical protein